MGKPGGDRAPSPVNPGDSANRQKVCHERRPTRSWWGGYHLARPGGPPGPKGVQYPQKQFSNLKPQVFSSPKTDTYPEHQLCRSTRPSLSKLRGVGHMKPLLAQFLRHLHDAGTFTEVRLVPIFVATLSSLFVLCLHLGRGHRFRVLLPSRP